MVEVEDLASSLVMTGAMSSSKNDCRGCCRIAVFNMRMCQWPFSIVDVEMIATAKTAMRKNLIADGGEKECRWPANFRPREITSARKRRKAQLHSPSTQSTL
mmetsp:Transcript_18191/g.52044  ORF Transcript_18191/g.52044 Transcript_18191/m.52044 type:complete len:102 (+) Transcript_18191:350-655(+)